MALNAIEQLKIIGGNPSPDEADLLSLVLQSAVIYGVGFETNIKDTTGNELASAYVSKFRGVVRKCFDQNLNTAESLRRLIIVILGGTSVTYAQVSAASDSAWIGFISANIDESMEFLGGVTAQEKAAYLAI